MHISREGERVCVCVLLWCICNDVVHDALHYIIRTVSVVWASEERKQIGEVRPPRDAWSVPDGRLYCTAQCAL